MVTPSSAAATSTANTANTADCNDCLLYHHISLLLFRLVADSYVHHRAAHYVNHADRFQRLHATQ